MRFSLLFIFILIIEAGAITGCRKDGDTYMNNEVSCGFPFPQHTQYAIDPMLPSNKTREQMDAMIIDLFKKILRYDLIVDANAPMTKDEFRMVIRHSQDWEVSEGYVDVSHINVSESQGYGMMIMAYMAGCEEMLNLAKKDWIFGSTGIKDYYDAMLRTVLAYPSIVAPNLFAWELKGYPKDGFNKTGFKVVDDVKTAPFIRPDDGDSATDGDMDIIYSLILADRQWGSDGKYNYIEIALRMLADLWEYCVHDEYHTLLLGDWAKSAKGIHKNASRPSDFIISHLKVFKAVDASHNWQAVIDATYNVIKEIRDSQNRIGNTNGLMPDFVIRGDAGWEIPIDNILEDDDGSFAYNACRVPWRLGTDYLLFGNTAIGDSSLFDYVIKPLDDFARSYTKGNLNKFGPLYMDGKPFDWEDAGLFAPPFLVTASAVGADQDWVNSFWSNTFCVDFKEINSYSADTYGDYIKILVMLTVSGNYWIPIK